MKHHVLLSAAVVSVLIGCSGSPGTDDGMEYPYFTSLPSATTLESDYKNLRHDLSPIERYKFTIVVPARWQTLDAVVKEEPSVGTSVEMGVFREPGEWMEDSTALQSGEIAITVVNMEGDTRWADVWLQETLKKNLNAHEIIKERVVETPEGNALDLLFTYNDGSQKIVTRMAAFRSGNRLYLISGSDSVNGYRDNAEAYYTAIATFTLEADRSGNPFLEE